MFRFLTSGKVSYCITIEKNYTIADTNKQEKAPCDAKLFPTYFLLSDDKLLFPLPCWIYPIKVKGHLQKFNTAKVLTCP